MTDDADLPRKKRQLLIGIVTVVLVIGLGGVVAALMSGSSDDEETSTTSSAAGSCQGDRIVTYRIESAKSGASTPAAAAKPWATKGEDTITTRVDGSASTVALAKPGQEAREVLTVHKHGGGWSISGTAACLYLAKGTTTCPPAPLVVDGTTYLPARSRDAVQPGQVVGQGTLTPCLREAGKIYLARGDVAPVTAFRTPTPDRVVLDNGGGSTALYAPK